MDCLKHILSGGYWKEGAEWVKASELVRHMLQSEPVIQCHLGWVPPTVITPGKYGQEKS
jgi:hypothetical protein